MPINLHVTKVSKDNTMIDDNTFLNVEDLVVKENRFNNIDAYFHIDEDDKIMDLF